MGMQIDASGIKILLETMFLNRNLFPIKDKDSLISSLGGEGTVLSISSSNGGKDAAELANFISKSKEAFEAPDEIVNMLVGNSYISSIIKSVTYNTLHNISYPVPDENSLTKGMKVLSEFGLSLDDLSQTLSFPLDGPESVHDALVQFNGEIFGPDVALLEDIYIPTAIAKPPPPKEEAKPVPLELGMIYLIERPKPDTAFEMAEEAKKNGKPVQIISRTNPKILKNRYDLEGLELHWLTESQSETVSTLDHSLERLIFTVEEFIDNNKDALIIFGGTEYLISNNQFDPVVKFLRMLVDKVADKQTCALLLPISPDTVETQQLSILEREMEVIKDEPMKLAIGEMMEVPTPPAEPAPPTPPTEPVPPIPPEAPEEIVPEKKEVKKLPSFDAADLDLGELESTIATSKKAPPQAPAPSDVTDFKTLLSNGKSAYRDEDYDNAIEYLDQALKLEPDDLETIFLRKRALAKAGKISLEVKPEEAAEAVPSKEEPAPSPPEAPAGPPKEEAALPSTPTPPAPDKPISGIGCNSCEGSGHCYWCEGSGNCHNCDGDGKVGKLTCESCNGSGKCSSCEGKGTCHWCEGAGSR